MKKVILLQLSENFVNFVNDDVAQLDINVEIVGTNDQPEIVFEALDDINVFLREGKNDTASGQLRISERDVNDQIFLSLEVPQSNIRDGSELQENGSIYLPIDFKLRNTETMR